MIDHNSMTPLYQQVSNQILSDVASGEFSVNKRLPTEKEMSEQYGVSRITVRRAVSDLVVRGVLVRRQGKGTFLKTEPMRKDLKLEARSFTELCQANGKTPGSKVLEAGVVVPSDPDVIRELGLTPGEKAVRILRLRYADDKPLIIEDNHFPLKNACLLGVDLEKRSLYQYLRKEMQIEISAGSLTLRIVRADAKSAKLLGIPRNTPLLHMWGTTLCGTGEILHTCRQVGYGEDFDIIIR